MPHPVAATTVRRALVRRIDSGELDLPLLPQVAGQVLSMSRDEGSDASGMADIIQRDQALAGHVMRVANSPAYMPRVPIVSLQQAIARMGMPVITEIAVATSIKGSLFDVPGHMDRLAELWRHALATGSWGKEIARARRRAVESSFLCGLLHRVGTPVVLQMVSDLSRVAGMTLTASDLDHLLAEFQSGVGARIAKEWSLPDPVRESIEYCDRYLEAPQHPDPAMVTHCAARLATHLLSPHKLAENDLRELAVFGELNLYPQNIDALLAKREEISELVEVMAV